ncbi:MAG: 8-oxo-dGTP diphosphatase [Bradymonadia bacterium]|jgi:8-oxo-dGTP diphosphatase
MPTAPDDLRVPIRVVAGAVIDPASRRVIVAQRAHGPSPRAGLWEFPGGKVESGETDAQALRRELEEELGVDVVIGAKLSEHVVHHDDLSIALVAYRCTLAESSPAPESREHAALRWVDAETLRSVVFSDGDNGIAALVGPLLG